MNNQTHKAGLKLTGMKQGITMMAFLFGMMAVNNSRAQGTYTLRQCIDTAIRKNITVQQTGLQADRAAIRLNQARMNMLPDLNGNVSYGWNQGRVIDPFTNVFIDQQLTSSNVGLSSNTVLFSGFRLQNAAKQNSLSYEASKLEWQQGVDGLKVKLPPAAPCAGASVLKIVKA